MLRALLLGMIIAPLTCFASVEPITIGLLPGGNPQVIEKESFRLADKLQKKLERPVQVFISKNYTGMIDALKAGRVDFAVLSSMTYVVAEKEVDLKVLLKKTWSNGPFYYSAIVTKAGGKIKKLRDIKGYKMAFVDEKSTSGYLYPKIELRKLGIGEKDLIASFSGSHASSIKQLEEGKVDVAAVFSDDEKARVGAWTRFGSDKKFKVKVLWTSEPIPNDPIVVRKEFYENNAKLTHEIMYTLIEIQNENQSGLSEILGTSELMPATSRQYDPVREMVKTFQSELKL